MLRNFVKKFTAITHMPKPTVSTPKTTQIPHQSYQVRPMHPQQVLAPSLVPLITTPRRKHSSTTISITALTPTEQQKFDHEKLIKDLKKAQFLLTEDQRHNVANASPETLRDLTKQIHVEVNTANKKQASKENILEALKTIEQPHASCSAPSLFSEAPVKSHFIDKEETHHSPRRGYCHE